MCYNEAFLFPVPFLSVFELGEGRPVFRQEAVRRLGWPEHQVLNQTNPLTGILQMSFNVCEMAEYF